ncbi:MAG: type 2 lanthipeptide synthetase LanM family protein [Cyanobacteriota bacterium]
MDSPLPIPPSLEPLSARHRRAWLEAVAPDEPHKLSRRLAWDGLDAAVLERQWSAQEAASGPDSPSWTPLAAETDAAAWWPALQACREALQAHWQAPLLPYDPEDNRPFVDLWWPIRSLGARRLRQALAPGLGDWIASEAVCEQLADCLLERLCALGDQLLWQGFNAGRKAGTILLAHLGAGGDGNGPPVREHYEAFIQTHRRDGLEALLREFPVLARLLGRVFTLWQEGSEELLRRIDADRQALTAHFSLLPGHRLTTVSQGLSDPHRGGRAVAILRFTSAAPGARSPHAEGDDAVRIVYKPKHMGVDAAYQAALADLNANTDLPPLRTLTVLAREGYGYMEWVPHRLCRDPAELTRFYVNAGRLLAVLHGLGCTDCHHENLIACGDQLLLIDTETLLEPLLPDHIGEAATEMPPAAPSHLQRRLQGSVLRSGILPHWLVSGVGQRAIDISALGVQPPRESLRPTSGWLGVNSDGMLPGRLSRPAPIPTSLPVGIGAANPFQDHLKAFCSGFERQCQALRAHRQRWLASDGALNRFRGLQRRIVLRPTRVYVTVLCQLLAPEALRSPFAQAMVLERLARSFLLAETRPLHWPVFAAEARQLAQLDIPFFTHQIDGDTLLLGDDPPAGSGSATPSRPDALPAFIRSSGLAAARERLRNLNEEEIAFQLRLIRGAASARLVGTTRPLAGGGEPASGRASSPPPAPPIDALEAASRLSRQLLSLAIVDPNGEIEWLGMDLGADGEGFGFGPVGATLYGGAMGIAILLRCLQDQGRELEPRPTESGQAMAPATVIEAILHPLRELVAQPQEDGRLRWWRDQPLGLSGCGGLLLGLQLLDARDLVEALLQAALPRLLGNDRALDLIGGCAGLIGPLLRHHSAVARTLALVAGDRLLERQNAQGAWSDSLRAQALLGFSHGTAGYAAALARLHQASGEERFLRAATAALAYERSRFDPQQGNWPDYRNATRSPTAHDPADFTVSWCHGAPGIALGRACLWGTALWDDRCVAELEAALRTTAAVREMGCDHLCCGNLGLMAVLELVGEGPWPLAQPVRDLCRRAARRLRDEALRRCAGTADGEPQLRCFPTGEGSLILPGFFTGLSGMGLALLEGSRSRRMLALLLTAGLWPLEE